MGHRHEVHTRVVDRRRTERHIAGGKLDAVTIDVEATPHVLDEMLVELGALLVRHIPACPDSRFDGLECRHEKHSGAACGIHDP